MKRSFQKIKTGAAIFAASVLIIGTSCTKDDNFDSERAPYMQDGVKLITDKNDQNRIKELKGMLPTVVVYNEKSDVYISLDLNNPKSFSFSNPSGGASFSAPGGSVQFVNNDGTYSIITTPSSAGGGGGGGVVSAGNISLEVNYVLCFNSGSAEDGIEFFDLGPAGSGFGGAIGIAGNFEQLMNADIDDEGELEVFDFFQGIVAFYAFDGQPSGSYPVINFLDAEEEGFDESGLNNRGIAYLLSFQPNNMGVFFSKSGTVNFGGSSVEFTGTYVGVTNFNWFEFDEEEPTFVEVPGAGVLECGG